MAPCGAQLQVYDQHGQGVAYTTAVVNTNEAHQHKTLLALFTNQKPFTFGATYTFQLQPLASGTITDANDFFSVTILY
jgi:hypothetical protein